MVVPTNPKGKMSLSSVQTGPADEPLRTMVMGVEGVGKTTFASKANAPIIIGAERGLGILETARFPQPETFVDVLDALNVLTVDTHPYKTLIIDTIDWIEPLIWAKVCKDNNKANIEDFGYGKGFNVALSEWRLFISCLERVQDAKRMEIILLAHTKIAPYKNPEGEDYDRFQLKLKDSAAAMLREWCDNVLFANYEIFVSAEDNQRAKAVSSGKRVMFTEKRAAWDAKNRYLLPLKLPFDYGEYMKAVAAGKAKKAA